MSAITTRSQASTRLAPPPAAVPFTAAITGFSQSRIDVTSRCQPRRTSRATSPERPVGRVVGPWRLRLLGPAEAGPRAEVLLAGAGEDDGPHAERGRELVEHVSEVVAHVGRERVPRIRSVERDSGDRPVVLDADQLGDGGVVRHGPSR